MTYLKAKFITNLTITIYIHIYNTQSLSSNSITYWSWNIFFLVLMHYNSVLNLRARLSVSWRHKPSSVQCRYLSTFTKKILYLKAREICICSFEVHSQDIFGRNFFPTSEVLRELYIMFTNQFCCADSALCKVTQIIPAAYMKQDIFIKLNSLSQIQEWDYTAMTLKVGF